MPWSQKGVGDGREGDRLVSRTMADGCQGLASAADYGAHAPGAGTLAPVWLLAQGWTASATAEALEGDPHTIGRWAAAFGEGGPAALIFEQTGGSPTPLARRRRRS